ncbi:hypothetical protein JL193_04770 [Polaribacter batillariae]|uniref:Uncharacterized protein n=1 Tax=Polaribacter batillariae TaxID=2808900 RepID=A0ABX7T012_9FLAO|nr:hypothetical protein [Polaribacter batillariae]QTD38596.1 hypothetical protein JL193_04770 [Polaribacter batillariae]
MLKNKNWDVFFMIVALLNVTFSFVGDKEVEKIFSYEINIWSYRILWAVLAVIFFMNYRKKKNLEAAANQK